MSYKDRLRSKKVSSEEDLSGSSDAACCDTPSIESR
ncbi:hypothetical protein LCGC14_2784430, partial [marine sediment metagenome]